MEIEDLITRLKEAVETGEITAYDSSQGGWLYDWRDLCQEALVAILGMQKLIPTNKTFDSHQVLFHGWVTCTATTDNMDGVEFKRGNRYEGEFHVHGASHVKNRKWVVWDKYGVDCRTFSVVEFDRHFMKGELAKELPDEQ